ncbi:hypothetical protein AB0M58_14390 [Streptomyces bobili]|uniref:hypothetical protein n=1 Tax=Streptomyces bobili TaxID=67280 RepID=UPI00342E3B2C
MVMNQHGIDAKAYWKRWLPARYAALPFPDTYFTLLGEQVEQQAGDLWDELVRRDEAPEGETHEERAGRLQLLKEEAVRAVLEDLVRLPPEPGTGTDAEDGLESEDSFQDRVTAFQQQLESNSTLVERLLDGEARIEDLSDDELSSVIAWMSPAFLHLFDTSVEAERAKGRSI